MGTPDKIELNGSNISSEDEIPIKKSGRNTILSDSDNDSSEDFRLNGNTSKDQSVITDDESIKVKEAKPRKRVKCLDSSESSDDDLSDKAKRKKKLEEMRNKLNLKKKKKTYSSS